MSSSISGANAIKGKLSEKEVISVSSNDGVILENEVEQANGKSLDDFCSEEHNEKSRLIKTAITIQAAIRGYQVFTSYIYTISFGSYVHYQIFICHLFVRASPYSRRKIAKTKN